MSDLEKFCTKFALIPVAFCAYFLGWVFYSILNFIAFILCPFIGPAFFAALAQRRLMSLASKGVKGAGESAASDVKQLACLAMALLHACMGTYKHMILPLSMLWDW